MEENAVGVRIVEVSNMFLPELKPYTELTRAQLQRMPQGGLFIAESAIVIGAALDAGCMPVSLLMERKQIAPLADTLLARCGNVPVYTAEREVLAGLTGYALTRGVLCAMRRPPLMEMNAVCAGARRIALLENIVDTTNMGAIFRSAAALGVDAVILSPGCCDPLSRRSARVSMGCVFRIPWAYAQGAWPDDAFSRLQAQGFRLAAMALDEHAVSVDEPSLCRAERLGIVLGTEGSGLARETIARCDDTVMIPMSHGVDSLNVAAASAVAFWTLCRQG